MYTKDQLYTAGKPLLLRKNGLMLDEVTKLLKKALEETNISAGLNIEIVEDLAEIRTIFSSKTLNSLAIKSLDDPNMPDYVLAYSWTGAFVDINPMITVAKPKNLPENCVEYFKKVDALVSVALTMG